MATSAAEGSESVWWFVRFTRADEAPEFAIYWYAWPVYHNENGWYCRGPEPFPPDPTSSEIHGSTRADGCTNWSTGDTMAHACCRSNLADIGEVLKRAYDECYSLFDAMPRWVHGGHLDGHEEIVYDTLPDGTEQPRYPTREERELAEILGGETK